MDSYIADRADLTNGNRTDNHPLRTLLAEASNNENAAPALVHPGYRPTQTRAARAETASEKSEWETLVSIIPTLQAGSELEVALREGENIGSSE